MDVSHHPRRRLAVQIAAGIIILAALALGVMAFINSQASPTGKNTDQPGDDKQKSINIGIQINDSPGFNVLQDGQRSGFDIDLANYIAEGMGLHANFVPITVGSRDQQLKEGYVDMVASTYSITDAHIDNGVIFAGPYIRTEQGIAVLKDNEDITSVGDLAEQTVCVTSGSTTETKKERAAYCNRP
jgi:glutamate transport system substrate-binding protein